MHLIKNQVKSLCIMNGLVMGSGTGLILSCKIRLATPKTVFAVPENSFGSAQDGMSAYFLANNIPFSLGLYLALTGDSLSGPDLFLHGIATHYVTSEIQISKLLSELKTSQNPYQTADKYHNAPQPSQNSLNPVLSLIENIFGKASSIEKLKENLSNHMKLENDENSVNMKFIKKTIQLLKLQCPLSLKVNST